MSHLFTFAGHGTYSPDGKVDVDASAAEAINAETTKQELAHWQTKPEVFLPAYFEFPADGPHTFTPTPEFPYLCDVCKRNGGQSPKLCNASRFWRNRPALAGATVTTWNGATLGTITDAKVYRHNFGGRFVALTVRGNNGATYHGRASWDSGTVIKLRRAISAGRRG